MDSTGSNGEASDLGRDRGRSASESPPSSRSSSVSASESLYNIFHEDDNTGNSTKKIPKSFQNTQAAWKFLGYNGAKEFHDSVNGPLFAPFFSKLLEKAIRPKQEQALQQDSTTRKREANLVTSETWIHHGNRGGLRKFSTYDPEFETFQYLDWYAWLLFRVTRGMQDDRKGWFYGRGDLSQHDMYRIVWNVLQLKLKDEAPSRVKLLAERKRKREEKTATRALRAKIAASDARRGTVRNASSGTAANIGGDDQVQVDEEEV